MRSNVHLRSKEEPPALSLVLLAHHLLPLLLQFQSLFLVLATRAALVSLFLLLGVAGTTAGSGDVEPRGVHRPPHHLLHLVLLVRFPSQILQPHPRLLLRANRRAFQRREPCLHLVHPAGCRGGGSTWPLRRRRAGPERVEAAGEVVVQWTGPLVQCKRVRSGGERRRDEVGVGLEL
ncbi:hypothetical protein VPH35_123537 [Triticum aestivum]|uniref:Uncharacterized protein n=1 Tax=Triticum urartu TaxID=4572 RepID=A0A8R7R537_TRIUA